MMAYRVIGVAHNERRHLAARREDDVNNSDHAGGAGRTAIENARLFRSKTILAPRWFTNCARQPGGVSTLMT